MLVPKFDVDEVITRLQECCGLLAEEVLCAGPEVSGVEMKALNGQNELMRDAAIWLSVLRVLPVQIISEPN